MKVPAVYSVHDDHLITRALETDYTYYPPLVTFVPVAGSAIKTNANDNKLPKIYLAAVRWTDPDIQRPRPGHHFRFRMPFLVLDCPSPPAGAIFKTATTVNEELV
jgi:hypothetical protein